MMMRHAFGAGAVELRNEVSRAVEMDLPGTLVFDYPTTAAISAFIFDKLAAASLASFVATGSAAAMAGSAVAGIGTVQRQLGIFSEAAGHVAPPLIGIEAVQGRLSSVPGAESPAPGCLTAAAAVRQDAITRVPLDRWDADQLLRIGMPLP